MVFMHDCSWANAYVCLSSICPIYACMQVSYHVGRLLWYLSHPCVLGDIDALVTVHPQFRCIVLVTAADVADMDPAFLGRFEKQFVDFHATVLSTPTLRGAFHKLQKWASEAAAGPHPFSERHAFGFWCGELLPSVLCRLQQESPQAGEHALVESAKKTLLPLTTMDGLLRAEISIWADSDPEGYARCAPRRSIPGCLLYRYSPCTATHTLYTACMLPLHVFTALYASCPWSEERIRHQPMDGDSAPVLYQSRSAAQRDATHATRCNTTHGSITADHLTWGHNLCPASRGSDLFCRTCFLCFIKPQGRPLPFETAPQQPLRNLIT